MIGCVALFCSSTLDFKVLAIASLEERLIFIKTVVLVGMITIFFTLLYVDLD